MIYLDNAATTFPKPKEVYEALDYAQRNLSFNAGRGAYKKSQECLQILDDLRKELSLFCNTNKNNVVLLSSATEALNMIINGLDLKDNMNIYITPFEHNAIIRPLYNLKKYVNFNIHILPFNKETWEPDIVKIENLFALNNPAAVFCSQISNVTGLMIDYSSIFEIAKKYNCLTVLDAAQGFGIIDVITTNTDFIIFAGHKSLYGPFGISGFVNCNNTLLKITKSGGNGSDTLNHNMPDSGFARYESGSYNIPAAYGLLKSIEWIKKTEIKSNEIKLFKYLLDSLNDLDNIVFYTPKDINKLFGIISFNVIGYKADEVGQILNDEFDICVRTGYHCAPFVHDFINSKQYGGTARISLGYFTDCKDIDFFVKALQTI